MIELILAFLLSLFPGHYHTTTNDSGTEITTMDDTDDTGGEGAHAPNQPPPPPPTNP